MGHVGKPPNGAKPAELPVPLPTKYEIVIIGKTAKAIGVKIPRAILARADGGVE